MGRLSQQGRWIAAGVLCLMAALAANHALMGVQPPCEPVRDIGDDVAPPPHEVMPPEAATVAPVPRSGHVAPAPHTAAVPVAPLPQTVVPAGGARTQSPCDFGVRPVGGEIPLPMSMPAPPAAPPAPLPARAPAPAPVAQNLPPQPLPAPQKPAAQPPRDTTRDPLNRVLEPATPPVPTAQPTEAANQASYVYYPTLGFAGQSGVAPRSGSNNEYDTIEDRWRLGFPAWDRYNMGHPRVFDYPYRLGRITDPFNQNVLKGDYPIIGQHTFFNFTGTFSTLFEGRSIPTATTPFESTSRPNTVDFFGRPGQFVSSQLLTTSFDLFHGDAAFKPVDWRLKLTPAVNVNSLLVQELAVVNPDVRKGTQRSRSWVALQEWFAEYKLADLSPEYDFVSVRAGSQPFTSDFRGFIYSDVNRGIRLFGNYDGNRTQYNLVYMRQLEKDTNSQLNTFHDRNQNIVMANVYRQDFLFPGYTAQASVHYNNDNPSFLFDQNGFLVRPDPAGVFQKHAINAVYVGVAGDGHIGRYNISHAFYWVLGRDSRNPIAGLPQSISAQMAALELSYDRDWTRFRVSGLYQSGDGCPNNGHATGFDGIFDNMNFGGEFSFWRRQRIPLFGVGLTNDQSQYANLRSSRIQGQSNFVNPGLWLINAGVDVDITPRFRIVNNANALLFDKTASLETFVFQSNISRYIGTDLSSGVEWRPRLNNNAIVLVGASSLIPGPGFRELYNKKTGPVNPLLSLFTEIIFQY